MKRILLVAEDKLVSNYHRVRFESMGLIVDTAQSIENARRLAKAHNPDLTLIDPIISGLSPIQTVETVREAVGESSIWSISPLPKLVAKAVEKAGANDILQRAPAAENLFAEVAEAMGIQGFNSVLEEGEYRNWVHSMAEAAPEAINSLRVTLHGFIRDPRNGVELYELFRKMHQLAHRVSMLGMQALGRFTSAVEAFVYDLYAMPEQINPSVARTVSQAIDLLSVLFEEETALALKDPASAEVFVVDDEPAARQMIGAAMKLAHLKITCAEDADMGLTVLADNQYDLIFLDVNLPQGSGFDLCTRIRELEDHRRTPVVFITGMNTFQNRVQGSLSGGHDFVAKPFNLLELGVKALMWIFKGQLSAI